RRYTLSARLAPLHSFCAASLATLSPLRGSVLMATSYSLARQYLMLRGDKPLAAR
ncbi:hypothetical protein BHM03_00052136, partial [Ensete ventricosum]